MCNYVLPYELAAIVYNEVACKYVGFSESKNVDKIPVSIAVICKNEAHNIERLLKSVTEFAEVIIVDSGSTDDTLKIAGQYTPHIYEHDWAGDGPQRQRAIAYCQYDWVLNLDADEQLTSELVAEIKAAIKSSEFAAYEVKFNDYFMQEFSSSYTKMHAKVRMFRKSSVVFQQKIVHASAPHVNGKIGSLSSPVLHYGDVTIDNKLKKSNLYSSLVVAEKVAKAKRASLLKLVFIFPLVFVKSYIIRRNFLNGKRGFIGSMMNAFYAFIKEAKLYEANQKNKCN